MASRRSGRNPLEMPSVAAATVYNQSCPVPSSSNIQKILDENAQLLVMIHDLQRKGKLQDCVPILQTLRQNLVYLVSAGNLNKNIQKLLPTPSVNVLQNIQSRRQQLQSPTSGYHSEQSIVAMRSPFQQYRPSPQYQRQYTYQYFASTQSSSISYIRAIGSVGVNVNSHLSQSYSGQGYGYQQLVPSVNYLNPYCVNLPTDQHYQPNGPYGIQAGSRYFQNMVATQLQNFAPNYPPSGYVQQQFSSSIECKSVTNQLLLYTENVNAQYGMQNMYSS